MDGKDGSLESVTKKLQEILQCPVCYEPVGTSVAQCLKGHGVCSKCKGKLSECPICSSKISSEGSVLLVQMITHLPKMCENKERGCEEIGSLDHQKFCSYRLTQCRVSEECSWQGFIDKLVDHLKQEHVKIPIIDADSAFKPYFHYLNVFELPSEYKVWTPVFAHKNFFWKYTELDHVNKRLIVRFYHLPQEKTDHVYYGITKFSNGNFVFSHVMKASIDEIEINCQKPPGPTCMVVPFEELFRFFTTSSTLIYSFIVVKEERLHL